MNITKNFETWGAFLDYVQELEDWLIHNKYIYYWRPNQCCSSQGCRNDIMKDEEQFIKDLKEKGLYEKYEEYFHNCKNYLDNNIVVRNCNKNFRYGEFDFSFRFVNQPENVEKYGGNYKDFNSVFVWCLKQGRHYSYVSWAFGVVHPIVFELPDNPDYYELGTCWYSKNRYSIDDIENGIINEYTNEDAIKNFIETIVKVTPHKVGFPKLACVKTVDKRHSSSAPGPVQHWEVGISGFELTPVGETYSIVSGVLSKSTCSVNLFYDTVSYENQKAKKLRATTKIEKIDKVIEKLGLQKENIKSITWFNEKGPTHIIDNNGDVAIYCYHKGLDEEFQSLRGNHTMNRPYDPGVWGWT